MIESIDDRLLYVVLVQIELGEGVTLLHGALQRHDIKRSQAVLEHRGR